MDTIAGALQLKAARPGAVAATRSLEAYDLYLLGRHHWSERSEAGMHRARELFRQALALDPAYAPAWSGLADASAVLASWQFADAAEMYPVATDAARRAMELDESLAEAHSSLGFVKMYWEWDWDGVLRELRRTIELNPNHETAHRWLSAFLAGIGSGSRGHADRRGALLLDPVSVPSAQRTSASSTRWRATFCQRRSAISVTCSAINPAFLRAYLFARFLGLQGKHEERFGP